MVRVLVSPFSMVSITSFFTHSVHVMLLANALENQLLVCDESV